MDKIDENDARIRSEQCKIENSWLLDEHNIQNANNSTLLYIAVEYLKDKNAENAPTSQSVQTNDPNNISKYNVPMYQNETSSNTYNNPIVLVSSNNTDGHDAILVKNPSMDVLPILSNTEMGNNHFLQLVNTNPSGVIDGLENGAISNKDQEVHVLITDQSTGISYSVSTQELLVEDQHLLEALSPNPLGLDTDFFTIDESTLKNNLPEGLIDTTNSSVVGNPNAEDENIVSGFISGLTSNDGIEDDEDFAKLRKRNQTTTTTENMEDCEDKLLSRVYSIIDKPIPSRARATLPETYLKISKVGDEWAVFAKKCIRKRTQFGPVQGVLKKSEDVNSQNNKLELLLEDDEKRILGLDITNEDESNWMCFIRRAESYQEQNLVVSQHEKSLYFTVIRNILPRQELKVGYSFLYANRYNLSVLEKQQARDENWPCFECTEQFPTSQDLQNHLELHDEEIVHEKLKLKRRFWKSNKRKGLKISANSSATIEACQCRRCQQVFNPPKLSVLKNHLLTKHDVVDECVEEHFFIVRNYKCDKCSIVFNSESLYKIHNLQHNGSVSSPDLEEHLDEETCYVCPSCTRKFPSKSQLILHVSVHKLPKYKMIPERFQCPVCYTSYPLRERLQKHMLVHGPEESKPLECEVCKKRFMNNSALTCHIKTHNVGENLYECPICKDRFDHVPKLKIHVQKHCVNNTYTCPYCNKKYRAYSVIRKHIRAFHTDKKHSCQHCAKVFPTIDKLKMHLLRHSDHREFLCADCGQLFKRKDKLTEHSKRVHSEERENNVPKLKQPNPNNNNNNRTAESVAKIAKVEPTDFHRFIYKCHPCLIGFKRRGMLVNHLAKRHPDISLDSVPELNLPILRATKDYYCQYCDKVYKSSSKRKAHILKNHPGAALPISNRKQTSYQDGLPNPSFSQTVGSVTTRPQNCTWCHKQYASKAKLLQHQRKEHSELLLEENHEEKLESSPKNNQEEDEEQEISFYPSDEFMVNTKSVLEEFADDPEPEDYCHLVNVPDEADVFQQEQLNIPNSHLYRLLTNTNKQKMERIGGKSSVVVVKNFTEELENCGKTLKTQSRRLEILKPSESAEFKSQIDDVDFGTIIDLTMKQEEILEKIDKKLSKMSVSLKSTRSLCEYMNNRYDLY